MDSGFVGIGRRQIPPFAQARDDKGAADLGTSKADGHVAPLLASDGDFTLEICLTVKSLLLASHY